RRRAGGGGRIDPLHAAPHAGRHVGAASARAGGRLGVAVGAVGEPVEQGAVDRRGGIAGGQRGGERRDGGGGAVAEPELDARRIAQRGRVDLGGSGGAGGGAVLAELAGQRVARGGEEGRERRAGAAGDPRARAAIDRHPNRRLAGQECVPAGCHGLAVRAGARHAPPTISVGPPGVLTITPVTPGTWPNLLATRVDSARVVSTLTCGLGSML